MREKAKTLNLMSPSRFAEREMGAKEVH